MHSEAISSQQARKDDRDARHLRGLEQRLQDRVSRKHPQYDERSALAPERGVHDEPISTQEVVSRGLVTRQLWREVEIIAQRLYARGVQVAAERGLILVDTKYEMGVYDGELVLVDELHTPDSSRYWYADTYDDLFRRGARQRKLDKEYLRQWLMDHGYMGNGKPPAIPPEVRLEVCRRYAQAFHLICGRDFQSTAGTAANEAALVLGAPI